ncbi:MAG: hypothetical protein KA413_00250 [Candidatus Methylopumilus sp.]|nr:hypothetical protein [Candidatus Methylopumilus sp.]
MRVEINHVFDLPDEDIDYQIVSQAHKMYAAIDELYNYLRRIRNYSEKEPSFEEIDEAILKIFEHVKIE